MRLELKKSFSDDAALRAEFDELAKKTFQLSFESWYQAGWWQKNYLPYTLFCGEKATANVSVNPMKFRLDGQGRSAVQLGTVMTAPEYRGKGLSAFLTQTVLMEHRGACDWMFLFANRNVLGFYPRFGFLRTREYRCSLPAAGGFETAQRMDLSKPADFARFRSCYEQSNPFSALTMEQNLSLMMFYLSSFLKDSVFFVPEEKAVVIAENDGDKMLCYDIFCPAGKDREAILRAAAKKEVRTIEFGWFPKEAAGCRVEPIDDEDNALFLLRGNEPPFAERPLRFPLLCHT